jgi:hypothetical protein
MKEEKKKMLSVLIYEEAKKNVGHYNMAQYKNKKAALVYHHNVCKRLVAMSEKYDMPMGVLVYMAVGTDAHKPEVFYKGYKRFNEEKAEKVIALCDIFAKKFGTKYRTNDRLIHTLSRYVEKCDGGKLKFRQLVNKIEKKDFKMTKFKTAKDFAQMLFKDEAVFSQGGYITSVSKAKILMRPKDVKTE